MAYARNRGGYYTPGWDIFEDPSQNIYEDPSNNPIVSGLQSRLQTLEQAGGRLKDVQAPQVASPTIAATSLGRISSLSDYISSGSTADLQSQVRKATTMAGNRPLPEAGYLTEKAVAGYGKGLSDIKSSAYGKATAMNLAEVDIENRANQARYNADLQNAMAQYNLEVAKAGNVESELKYLQQMIDKYTFASSLQKESAAPKVSKVIPSAPQQLSATRLSGLDDTMKKFRETYSSGGTDPYWWTGSPRKG